MKAMIFAAGLGTRLKPLTDTLPKALVPVGGKPLIELTLDKLRRSGFDEAVINVHHFADKIEEWLAGQDWISLQKGELAEGNMLVQVSDERKLLLETGGAVLHARKYLEGCGHFLIHNVDILSNCDLDWLMAQVRPDALATLLVSKRKSSRYLLFEPDTMRLVGWMNEKTGELRLAGPHVREEECLKLAFSGIHIMSDQVLDVMESYAKARGLYITSDTPRFPVMDFYLNICHLYNIYGVCSDDLRLVDVGKLDTLGAAEEFLKTL
jgi:NDP-sugar pyrophosphorylase family protein